MTWFESPSRLSGKLGLLEKRLKSTETLKEHFSFSDVQDFGHFAPLDRSKKLSKK
jgi:hypothetical protein